jgi:DeoR family suf operon transcriptional repressor
MPVRKGPKFDDSTRGQIVARLQQGATTVDALASELGLTDNAIRQHLSGLERDGVARQAGVRRLPGAGKPATLYEINPDEEAQLSRAYAPLLTSLLEVLQAELPAVQVKRLLRMSGKRVAVAGGGGAAGVGGGRAKAAAAVLEALGGTVEIEEKRSAVVLRGAACPLAAAVQRNPGTCEAVRAMLAQVSGAEVVEECDRTARPRCCFSLAASA